MAFSFTYRGVRSEDLQIQVTDIRRTILPPNDVKTIDIPGRFGDFFVRSEYGMRAFEVDILINKQLTLAAIQEQARIVANFLDATPGLGELIFDDDTDKAYQAIISGETNVEQITRFRQGTIIFLAPYPFSESLTEKELTINGFQSTFTRASTAYDADGVSYASGAVRYGDGRFGDAIYLEEGTANLLSETLSYMKDSTALSSLVGLGAAFSLDVKNKFIGAYSLKVATNGSAIGEGVETTNISLTASQTFTFSVYVIAIKNTTVVLEVEQYNVSSVSIGVTTGTATVVPDETNPLQRIYLTFTTLGTEDHVKLRIKTASTIQYTAFWTDGWQVENKDHNTSWHIGGGTRANEIISFPIRNYLRNSTTISEGTIEFDFLRLHDNGGTFSALLDWGNFSGGNTVDRLVFTHGRSIGTAFRTFQLNIVNGAITSTQTASVTIPTATVKGQWYRVVGRYDFITDTLRIDVYDYTAGAWYTTTVALTFAPPTFNSFQSCTLGEADSTYWVNCLIDEFRATNRYKSDAEIQAAVIDTRPMAVDEDKVVKLAFDSEFQLYNTDLSNVGTAEVNYTITAVITGAATYLQVSHLNTGKLLRVQATFNVNDVIVFDAYRRIVYVNGITRMEYLTLASAFFKLPKDDNVLNITTDGTALAKIVYKPVWL